MLKQKKEMSDHNREIMHFLRIIPFSRQNWTILEIKLLIRTLFFIKFQQMSQQNNWSCIFHFSVVENKHLFLIVCNNNFSSSTKGRSYICTKDKPRNFCVKLFSALLSTSCPALSTTVTSSKQRFETNTKQKKCLATKTERASEQLFSRN